MDKRKFFKTGVWAVSNLGLVGSTGLFNTCSPKASKSDAAQRKYSGLPLSVSKISKREKVDNIFKNNAPQNCIFAANCTVPSETSRETLRSVIDYAHEWRLNNN